MFPSIAQALANSLSVTREYCGAEVVVKRWKEEISRIKIISKRSRNKRVVRGRKWKVLHKVDACVMWEGVKERM